MAGNMVLMLRLLLISLPLIAVNAQAQSIEQQLARDIMARVSKVAIATNEDTGILPKPCSRGTVLSIPSKYEQLCSRFFGLSLETMQAVIAAAVLDHSERHPWPPAHLLPWERNSTVVDSVVGRGASSLYIRIFDVSPRSLLIAWEATR